MSEHYITIPDSLFETIPNDSERLLIGDLIALSNEKGFAHPSDDYLVKRYHTNKRTIQRRLAHLEELGLIRRETKHVGYSDMERRIYITLETVSTGDKNVVTELHTGDKNDTRTGDKNVVTTGDKNVVQNNQVINNQLNNQVKSLEKSGYSDDFESFWRAYPKDKATDKKATAYKRFKTVLKTMSLHDLAVCLKVSSEQWKKEKRESQYIPMAATWLNVDDLRALLPNIRDQAEKNQQEQAELEALRREVGQ
ncbi:MAG: helix-turn-helix domain-containing protein [Oenococcus sp.]|uniref:helix-turn-helix domain-containing protein n=1 Tax=Oenococcus sp. TaxID=1979414 RepID=UPI0039EB70F0